MSCSGIKLDCFVDECVERMKMPAKYPKNKQYKLLVLCINSARDTILVDEEKSVTMDAMDTCCDGFKEVMERFKEKECCFAIYDCEYDTKDCGCRKDLVFISWCPDSAAVKDKMVYSASKDAVTKKYSLQRQWQMSDCSDKNTENLVDLIEKFGSKGAVCKIEGKPI